jgi:hypothetical protein
MAIIELFHRTATILQMQIICISILCVVYFKHVKYYCYVNY